MYVIELDDGELGLVRSALEAYRHDFGHEESDVLHMVKRLLAKLPKADHRIG